MTPAPLVPETRTARCRDARRFPAAFGSRFFLALLLGTAWLGPAWFEPRFALFMLAWDALVLLAWLADYRSLPKPDLLEVTREWPEPVSLDSESVVVLRVENRAAIAVRAEVMDTVPQDWRSEVPRAEMAISPSKAAEHRYRILPKQRGDALAGEVYLRLRSARLLAERWVTAELPQTVRVYPNLRESRKLSLYLIRSRQIHMERRLRQRRGQGREFDSLRDYQPGDEKRSICWTATARRARLVTKTYQHERCQAVYLVLDAGRLMLARSADNAFVTKLDHAASAALALAHVALLSGDRTGLLAYGRTLQARVPAARGSGQLRAMLDRLAVLRGELSEAAHSMAADCLLATQSQRSLVLWLTDLAETAATPEVIEAASRVAGRHLVVFVAIGQPQLRQLASKEPRTRAEMYRYAAALEMIQRREALLGSLRARGARVLELNPDALAPAVVNEYLRIKERGLL